MTNGSAVPGMTLLIGMSLASAYGQLDQEVRTRAFGVVFDGLAAPGRPYLAGQSRRSDQIDDRVGAGRVEAGRG
jgi:hypothetical protein